MKTILSTLRLSLMLLPLILLGSGCASVPLDIPKEPSVALQDNSGTGYGRLVEEWAGTHGSKSGFFPFVEGMDALGARLELADNAEASIDLQYFLMKDDSAGMIMSEALWRAADKGVRVRFLLDDVFTTAPDSGLRILNSHPNIEVRLFNPISRRGFRSLNFLGHFRSANRRMHNKSFTVDNAISIVGGRNIADEYFELKTDSVFADFDVLAFGPVVNQVSRSFDDYWNHALAIPIEQVTSGPELKRSDIRRFDNNSEELSRLRGIYEEARNKELLKRLASGEQPLYIANARVIADSPDKLQRAVGTDNMQLASELGQLLQSAERELVFISPYYVPGKNGIEFVRNILDRDVKIVMVTNSLASTNHIPVHSAYSGYRRKVLRAGMELYEVRANAGRQTQGAQAPEQLTLHTKLIVIDRRYLFVGSLNLDPRSIEINAEMGLLIDSPELAERIAEGLKKNLPEVAYRVVENERGALEWHTRIDGREVIETSEPLSSPWRRFKAWILKIAPEGQL